MSAESDFRAAALAHAPLAALVGTRLVQNGVDEGTALPYAVFTTAHEPVRGLLGPTLGDTCTITVECWGASALDADAVADQVEAAMEANAPGAATVIARNSGFDPEQGLDATVLTIEWWS